MVCTWNHNGRKPYHCKSVVVLHRCARFGIAFFLGCTPNRVHILFAAGMVARVYHERPRPQSHLENYLEAFAATARYVRYTPGIQVILMLFFISLLRCGCPALLPVIALQHLRVQVNQLGFRSGELCTNPGFAVSNQKGESEIFLALNTRHLRREKFGWRSVGQPT